jgi:hypothetical protein
MSIANLCPMYVNWNIGISRCNSVISNVQMETPEDDPLRVETCSVTQINKKVVTLTAKFVLFDLPVAVDWYVVFFLLLMGWDLVPCTAPTSGLLYQPQMR